ncbi:MAG: hypothetical protein V1678_03040 [Candidatus Aenigmatarchaeota archaeon]
MKGIELPINILVVVAIAVIVLLGMVALYFIGIGPMNTTTSLEATKNTACRLYNGPGMQCINAASVVVYYPAGNSTPTTLSDFTNDKYGCSNTATDENCARRVCGCPGY